MRPKRDKQTPFSSVLIPSPGRGRGRGRDRTGVGTWTGVGMGHLGDEHVPHPVVEDAGAPPGGRPRAVPVLVVPGPGVRGA